VLVVKKYWWQNLESRCLGKKVVKSKSKNMPVISRRAFYPTDYSGHHAPGGFLEFILFYYKFAKSL